MGEWAKGRVGELRMGFRGDLPVGVEASTIGIRSKAHRGPVV